jgi:hypothetical protein
MYFVACYLKLQNELELFWDKTWEGGVGWCSGIVKMALRA